MYRSFLLVTMLSFVSAPHIAYSMESDALENTGSATSRRAPVFSDIDIQTHASSNAPELNVSEGDDSDEGDSHPHETGSSPSPHDISTEEPFVDVTPSPTYISTLTAYFFFWQASKSEVIQMPKGEYVPLQMEDFVMIDFPDDNAASSSRNDNLEEEAEGPSGKGKSSSSSASEDVEDEFPSLITLALMENDEFERALSKHPDAPTENLDGSVVYKSREASRRFARLLDQVDETREGIKAGNIIPSDDPDYYKKQTYKLARKAPMFVIENFAPLFAAVGVRCLSNIALSTFGPQFIERCGVLAAEAASSSSNILVKLDFTGVSQAIITRMAASQARAEAFRHLGDIASFVERHGGTIVLTGINLGVTTYNFTSSAMSWTYNAMNSTVEITRNGASSVVLGTFSGANFVANSLSGGTMSLVSSLSPQRALKDADRVVELKDDEDTKNAVELKEIKAEPIEDEAELTKEEND